MCSPPAADRLELLAAAGEALAVHDLRVADLDDTEPVREVLRRLLDPKLPGSWRSTPPSRARRNWGRSTGTRPSATRTPPRSTSRWPDEPRTTLSTALEQTHAHEGAQPLRERGGATGYVVGLGTRWALLQIVNDDVTEDGFLATSVEMVAEIEVVDPERSFFPRVLALWLLSLRPPDVDLDHTRALLQSAQRSFPLFETIQTEEQHPGACYIGRIAALDDEAALLHFVSPAGEWDEEERVPLRDDHAHRLRRSLRRSAGPGGRARPGD